MPHDIDVSEPEKCFPLSKGPIWSRIDMKIDIFSFNYLTFVVPSTSMNLTLEMKTLFSS